MQFFQNRDRTITLPNCLEQDRPGRYLKFWGNDYPYLGEIGNNMQRWLPIPENSKAQRFIRLRQNTLRLATGMNGEVNRAVDRKAKAGWLWRNSA